MFISCPLFNALVSKPVHFMIRSLSRSISNYHNPKTLRQFSSEHEDSDEGRGSGGQENKNITPSRYDTCKVFVSGVIGTEPKEAYLSNNHYVINFSLAVVGQFSPIHDWEKTKNAETMWIGIEVWDEVAKQVIGNYNKGSHFAGMAVLMHNKWKDKVTGEEKKQYKLRMLKVMDEDSVKHIGLNEEEYIAPIESDYIHDQEDDMSSMQVNPPVDTRSRINSNRGAAQRGSNLNQMENTYQRQNDDGRNSPRSGGNTNNRIPF